MSCEKGFSSGEPNKAPAQNIEANGNLTATESAYSNSVFSDEAYRTPMGNAGDPRNAQNCMLPRSINKEMVKFGNHIGGCSPPQGLVDTSGDEPICFVRVDKDYFLQLLKNNQGGATVAGPATNTAQPPYYSQQQEGVPQQQLGSDFIQHKNSKLNGFPAALFLTPPKLSSDSVQSTPSPMNLVGNQHMIIGSVESQMHQQQQSRVQAQQHQMYANANHNNFRFGIDMRNSPQIQNQNQMEMSQKPSMPSQPYYFTSPQQSQNSHYNGGDDSGGNNALLMSYGGIFLGRELLSLLESSSSSSSPGTASGSHQKPQQHQHLGTPDGRLSSANQRSISQKILTPIQQISCSQQNMMPSQVTPVIIQPSQQLPQQQMRYQQQQQPHSQQVLPPTFQTQQQPAPTVNNIIINNYNGSVLKNITNLEPFTNQRDQYQVKPSSTQVLSMNSNHMQPNVNLPPIHRQSSLQQVQHFQMMFDDNLSCEMKENFHVATFKRESSYQQEDGQQQLVNDENNQAVGGLRYRKKTITQQHQNQNQQVSSNVQSSKNQQMIYAVKNNPNISAASVQEQQQQAQQQQDQASQFNFPDGGWVCSQCQNYNFYGRVKCNRCQKIKNKQDFNGKPKHLLKKNGDCLNPSQLSDSQQVFIPNQQVQEDNFSSENHHYESDHGISSTQTFECPNNNNKENNINIQNTIAMQFETLSLNGESQISNPTQNENESMQQQQQVKKPLTERVGDWVCPGCKNLNFSFRKICNRCQLNRFMQQPNFKMPPSNSIPVTYEYLHNPGVHVPQQHNLLQYHPSFIPTSQSVATLQLQPQFNQPIFIPRAAPVSTESQNLSSYLNHQAFLPDFSQQLYQRNSTTGNGAPNTH